MKSLSRSEMKKIKGGYVKKETVCTTCGTNWTMCGSYDISRHCDGSTNGQITCDGGNTVYHCSM